MQIMIVRIIDGSILVDKSRFKMFSSQRSALRKFR